MKRALKFRAWDKQNKCWFKPVYEAYANKLSDLMIGLSGDMFEHTMKGIEHESLWPDKFELVQFIGLKDKNGKEIYEGDIIRFGNAEKVECEIVWVNDICQFRMNPTFKHPKYMENAWDLNRPTIEIIGNIYENPDLLCQ
jgi:uncharacterized phage protein (TIGR01671 family)